MDLYQTIGRRLARLREARGWTQEQLAEAAGLSTVYVGRIEAGAKRPSVRALQALVAALDAPLWRLFSDLRLATEQQEPAELERRLLAAARRLDPADLALLVALVERIGTR